MNIDIFELIEHTHRNIFLTGKAGTGKTTFLNNFIKKTRKKCIVVAPTGIAAINAGGVTIHSMFGLPLRTFIPTLDRIDESLGNNINDLSQHFRYRKEKLKLLREVEIIIIDEVSMLRADVLDMIDFSLRHIRRNSQQFGGVQMLFIGDLHQLPPVVKEESFLLQYYNSPFFFSAKSLEDAQLITIELTKVYRQTDEDFVKILNGIRDSTITKEQLDALNERYNPNFDPEKKQYVYLTSHNHQAETINQKKLQELKGKTYAYEASIVGEFNEQQYPVEKIQELKVGAQVMFVRNDPTAEKKYFNGKLAEIIRLNEDEITVHIDGSEEEYRLKKEVWENKRYTLGAENQIVEEVVGSFEQYPIRLAWAVTIHKSQGLTFDRVIIDAGRSFASGQVYVALSRCRTLEGIILKSKISPHIIFKDKRVEGFQKATHANEQLREIYEREKYDYAVSRHLRSLDPSWVLIELKNWYKKVKATPFIDMLMVNNLYQSIAHDATAMEKVYQKYNAILRRKIVPTEDNDTPPWSEIKQKAKGSVEYFFNEVEQKVFNPLKELHADTKENPELRDYNTELKKFIDDTKEYLEKLQDSEFLGQKLFTKKKKILETPPAKMPTQVISWKMFSEEEKSIKEIARERGLTVATIISHFAKYAENGTMTDDILAKIIDQSKINTFKKRYPNPNDDNTLAFWKTLLPSHFEFAEIRLLLAYFRAKNQKL